VNGFWLLLKAPLEFCNSSNPPENDSWPRTNSKIAILLRIDQLRLIIAGPGVTVMRRFKGSVSRIGINACIVLVAGALLFPGYPSVLCIAPGHVAIEDFRASCCVPSHLDSQDGYLSCSGFSDAGDCRDCTDLLILAYARGAVLQWAGNAPVVSFTVECFRNLIPAGASPRHSQPAFNAIHSAASSFASAPLRC
jgi:hypothetical protein